jgi:subtilase family serine protease
VVDISSARPLRASGPLSVPGTTAVAAVHDLEPFVVHLILRRRAELPSIDALGALPPRQRQHLTSEEFEVKHGADPADVERIRDFARTYGLEIRDVSLAKRTLSLLGPAAGFARAFSVELARFTSGSTVYRGHVNDLTVPHELFPAVTAVLGLDERPAAHPGVALHPGFNSLFLANAGNAAAAAVQQHLQRAPLLPRLNQALSGDKTLQDLSRQSTAAMAGWLSSATSGKPSGAPLGDLLGANVQAQNRWNEIVGRFGAELGEYNEDVFHTALLAYLNALGIRTPPQVAELYDFPPQTDGSGQCIGIIELGGGYVAADVDVYFKTIGVPAPKIVDVPVAGGENRPLINPVVDSEICIDLEVAGSIAPGAKLACYFAPCTCLGFIDAINSAIHDRENRPSVLSISWSLSEAAWLYSPMVVGAFEEALKDAAMLGITVCCASGDYGATSEIHDGRAWVDYPSSSPYILSCGGTALYAGDEQAFAETAWNTLAIQGQATGGGISEFFALPEWQKDAGVPPSINFGGRIGRGVPDVAAVSDPLTGYFVRVDGTNTVMAGTSSAAPLWCGLLARISQRLGTRLGYINPLLYQIAKQGVFRDIVIGNNGGYSAGPGWDACTGLGRPIGSRLLEALAK